MKDINCVVDPTKAIFLHDRAPCMKALETQLLKSNDIDFFDNSEWPGNSPDLNPAEGLGAILMDRIDLALDKSASGINLVNRTY